MSKLRHFIIFIFLVPLISFSQSEASVWYFGEKAGIKFNPDGSTTPLLDGQLNTLEGCASLSDTNGEILFYTDGITVYNKNHQVMLNGLGLTGHLSSTQSATIIQKPGSSSIFYIFTIDAVAKSNGLRYSEVDLTLDGGLGGVTSVKNIALYTPTCEKISIVKHANNTDFWVITHGWQDNTFYSHLVSATGVNPVPVLSSSGQFVGGSDVSATQGYMKISPDGKKIVLCHQFLSSVELFDFDTISGSVGNPKIFTNKNQPYGAEFSADSKVLYVSLQIASTIYQYDLNATDIAGSEQLVFKSPIFLGALQLGPNDKIYFANYYTPYLGIINNPGVLGTGCDVQSKGADLARRNSTLGLPAFNQSFFNPSFKAEHLCFGEETKFSLSSNPVVSAAVWDFGDGTTSTDLSPLHRYSSPGKYTVQVSATSSLGTGVKTREVNISKVPVAYKPKDLLVCDDNNDGFYDFNLTGQDSAILNGQDPQEFAVRYYADGNIISTPTYRNKTAYQDETITAEVINKFNNACQSSTTFALDVFDSPKPASSSAIADLTSCDNTSIGTDIDGKILFDLRERNSSILKGQSSAQFMITYFKDSALTLPIVQPEVYQNTNPREVIYVKVANKDNLSCFATTSFVIEVLSLPAVSNVAELKQCDDDTDGYSLFNLEQSLGKIGVNAAVHNISFHKNLSDAENNQNPILNRTSYKNQTVSSDYVFARVSNSNGCYRSVRLNLLVSTTQIPSKFSRSFTQCDELLNGEQDGIAEFDFSSVTQDIKDIFPSGQLLDISYYQSMEDALMEQNAITDPGHHRNTNSPNQQKIFIRVDSRINNDCLGLGGYITLNVEKIPVIKSVERIHCDDNHDGLFAFDTSDIEKELLNGLSNVTVSYWDENNKVLPSPLPNPFLTGSQTIKAIVVNNNPAACQNSAKIVFTVDKLPEIFPLDPDLITVCDDEQDPLLQDGKYAFDTSSFEVLLLGAQEGMMIRYYDSQNRLLPSPLPNPFISGTQMIRAEAVNSQNPNCSAGTILHFIVNQRPKIKKEGEELVCSNLPSFTKEIDAGLTDPSKNADYEYRWYFNNTLIADQTHYSLTVNKEGVYKAVVSSSATKCESIRNVKVSASDIASSVIVTVDESNTITISAQGKGDYVYALDDENGSYQQENIFRNVPAGIHTVYVKDQNGCGVTVKEASVFGVPAFFTPNSDGYNDYWNVQGIDVLMYPGTTVHIYDRYGKLLKEISPWSEGWDGNYLGNQMPGDDYWYVIKMQNDKVVKGHFSLKR